MATSKKTAKKTRTTKKSAKKARATKRAATPPIVLGSIAHTEFASSDPAATKQWAAKALGWKFMPAMPMPGGDYHMWEAGEGESGGIRANNAPETPGTIVYVAVANIQRAYEKALKNGAAPMMPPQPIGGDMGQMAIVNAPGGVAIGLWSQK